MEKIACKNLLCEADGAHIDSMVIDDIPFTGFSGRTRASRGIEFSANWENREDHLLMTLILKRVEGEPSEGAEASFLVPYPEKQSSLMVWSGREGYPKSLCDVGGTELIYGDVCFGTILPMVSLYIPGKNVGLTIARDPGRTGGRLSFRFGSYHEEGMEVRVSALAIARGEERKFSFRFFPHEGCWRPGLKMYSQLFPEYFEAGNPEGNRCRSFVMTNPFFTREAVEELSCDWAEIHNHFPYYGNYLPEESSWKSVAAMDYPKDAVGRDMTLSREKIQQHIEDLRNNHIRSLYYIQCSGDAFIPWAEKTFPESIAKDQGNHLYRTWIDCCFCNGDESTPFGKYLKSQLEKILTVYPQLDGFFVDQLCYQTFDYAHKDGKSAVNGQEVYEYGASLEKNFQFLVELAHKENKVVVVNGPFDMDVAKGADGIMSEGTGSIFDTYRYLCLRRKMLVHEFPIDTYQVECMLRTSLLAAAGWSMGGSPSCERPMEFTQEMKELFRKYMPLLETLKNAELLLTADPLRWSPRELARGEIYRDKEEGNYLIPMLEGASFHYSPVTVSLKVPEEIREISIMYLEKGIWEKVSFTKEGDRLLLTLEKGFSSCIIKLQP